MADAISVFISYSHSDMDFVDRLEADLRARGFVTWVDRRRLEGTVEWQPQIDKAINAFPMMIVVLSPDALGSEFVRYEYERGHKLGKRIVTVRCEEFKRQLPPELSGIQYVDFKDESDASYENALRELIDGCQNPPPYQNTDPHLLYQEAHNLEGPDPEQAASLYQRLLIRGPQYASGEAQRDFERLNQRLYPQRVRRLREQAELAHLRGAYGAEAGALRALIALGEQDHATFEWAREYLGIAEENSQQMDLYDYIQKLVKRGAPDDLADARSKLETLWGKARFFRDPAGIAPTLSLKVPITYEQWKEERLAGEAKARKEQEAASDREAQIAQAQSRAKAATDEENARWEVARAVYTYFGTIVAVLAAIITIAVGVPFVISHFSPGSLGAFWGIFVLSAISLSLIAALTAWLSGLRQRPKNLQRKQTPNLITQLITLGGATHSRRLSRIESEELRMTSEAQAWHQQRMTEIVAEHARTMANIEARYPN